MPRHFVLLALVFASCGGRATQTLVDDKTSGADDPWSPQDGPQGSGGAGTGGTSTETGGMGSVAGGNASAGGTTFGGVEAFCERACDVEPSVCLEYACAEDGECLTLASRWPDDAREAFVLCVENDPLCFERAEFCILRRLFEGEALPVRVVGTGLSNEDGTLVAVHAGAETKESRIVDGGFSISVASQAWRFSEPAIVWVDENRNETCDADVDRFSIQYSTFNGDFEAPVFESELSDENLNTWSNDFCADRF